MIENADDEDGEREKNCRDSPGMEEAVHRVLVAPRILRDPLFGTDIVKHGGHDLC